MSKLTYKKSNIPVKYLLLNSYILHSGYDGFTVNVVLLHRWSYTHSYLCVSPNDIDTLVRLRLQPLNVFLEGVGALT